MTPHQAAVCHAAVCVSAWDRAAMEGAHSLLGLALIVMLAALVAVYVELVRALWLRFGGFVHGAIWRAFIAIGAANDRLDAEIDAAMAARKAGGG